MADIQVELIDHMGSDLTVVNAARVSFDKESQWVFCIHEDEGNDCKCKTSPDQWEPLTCDGLAGPGCLTKKDEKLISYLAKHNHWSPFAHCFAQFRIKAPIFVARQLVKHQVGLAWNEVSRRYVDSEPEFHTPTAWRKRAENVKQGSSDEEIVPKSIWAFTDANEDYSAHLDDSLKLYQSLLDQGVAPEQARMVLPQSMMTEWIWSGSLMAFARVYNLRTDPHAQQECRDVAHAIGIHMCRLFPESWKVLTNA